MAARVVAADIAATVPARLRCLGEVRNNARRQQGRCRDETKGSLAVLVAGRAGQVVEIVRQGRPKKVVEKGLRRVPPPTGVVVPPHNDRRTPGRPVVKGVNVHRLPRLLVLYRRVAPSLLVPLTGASARKTSPVAGPVPPLQEAVPPPTRAAEEGSDAVLPLRMGARQGDNRGVPTACAAPLPGVEEQVDAAREDGVRGADKVGATVPVRIGRPVVPRSWPVLLLDGASVLRRPLAPEVPNEAPLPPQGARLPVALAAATLAEEGVRAPRRGRAVRGPSPA